MGKKYLTAIEANFNYLRQARLERLEVLPDSIELSQEQDGWFFSVPVNGELIPYYFNGRSVVPFSRRDRFTPSSHRQIIGDGQKTEFVITHNLNTSTVVASVYEVPKTPEGDSALVDCEIIRRGLNQMVFRFSPRPPAVGEFEVVIIAVAGA